MEDKGFTLIELLVVVAIIGILAAVGVVAYNGYTKSAKINATKANHKTIAKMIGAKAVQCSMGKDIEYLNTKGNKPSEWFLKIEVPGHDTIRKKGKLNCSDRQAELYATVKGLDKIKFLKDYKIYLHVSDYIKNGIKDWLLTWIDNGWKTSENKEVKYVDLWKNINTLIEGFQWKNIKFSSQR